MHALHPLQSPQSTTTAFVFLSLFIASSWQTLAQKRTSHCWHTRGVSIISPLIILILDFTGLHSPSLTREQIISHILHAPHFSGSTTIIFVISTSFTNCKCYRLRCNTGLHPQHFHAHLFSVACKDVFSVAHLSYYLSIIHH